MGAHAESRAKQSAVHGAHEWFAKGPFIVEPGRPTRTPSVAAGSSCEPTKGCFAGFVPTLSGIDDLDQQVSKMANQHPQAQRLMTHPGVGPVAALATEVFLGDPKRFVDGKTVASYIGMIPSEHSSGRRQRLGAMSKQGNALVRYLWCEAAMHAFARDPKLKRFYTKGMGKARIAAAPNSGSDFGS